MMAWIFIFILSVFCCVNSSYSYQFANSLDQQRNRLRIVALHIRSEIQYRFATTHVTSSILNEDLKDRETIFDVTLPEAAFISNFSLEIMGKRYIGEIKDKETAKKQYDQARQRGQSAGHVGMKPRDTNKFKVAINVAALSEVTFYLTYNEILQRRRGSYDHTIYINPRQIVDDFRIEVYIQESREITLLRVPPLRNDILSNYNTAVRNRYAIVDRTSPTSAFIRYNPSREDQIRASMHGLSGLFIVEYDVDRKLDAGDVLIVDGFFVHFFAPTGLYRMARRILFILDTSGSMIGTKMQQLKDAMMQILDDLQENDLFNIIEFNDKISRWSTDLPVEYATPDAIDSAKTFIKNLTADGWTNINDAVLEGLSAILNKNISDSDTTPVIIFLTDGDPTAGETDTAKILNSIQGRNTRGVPIFSLAFGENADYNFMKKMSAQNNAFCRKIYEASDATLQLTGFYDEVSSVLISNLTFQFIGKETVKSSITNALIPNYFEGSEIIITGQLASRDLQELRLSVTGNGLNGTMELRSASNIYIHGADHSEKKKFEGFSYSHIAEKMWAYLTIKQLLNDRLRELNTTMRHDMKYRALKLALKYNFVTPLTSMVVTTPLNRGQNNVIDPNDNEFGASDDPYSYWSNNIPQAQAFTMTSPSFVDNDPHFIVHMKGIDTSVCFDIMGIPGDIINLVRDEISGIVVNGIIVSNKRIFIRKKRKEDDSSQELKTYLGSIVISGFGTHISITPERWILNGDVHKWLSSEVMTSYKTKIVTDGTGEMIVVMFPNRITLLVMKHTRTKSQKRAGKVDFLGFYIVEDRGFSESTHGLLGQFLYRKVTLEKKKTLKNGRTRGKLKVHGNTRKPRKVFASLGRRLNLATNSKIECWMVQNNGKRLLDGNYMDYINRRNVTDYINRLGGGG
ncbi:inter-alpha-trypsin inhibitor heavy chain H3-like isoform X1 [Mytilus galloprovincialis]|uniref:inter-alpha-trypsin inhibitor heavy chain H3-like isoform X1 n=2 Tax=Mytilus galloprovincialis TaxID=29158 RepID=UPI003F7BD14D